MAVACFFPDRAKDLSAPPCILYVCKSSLPLRFLRKILTSVHGYDQDWVQPVSTTSLSNFKIKFIILVPYMDTSVSVLCCLGTSKKCVYSRGFISVMRATYTVLLILLDMTTVIRTFMLVQQNVM